MRDETSGTSRERERRATRRGREERSTREKRERHLAPKRERATDERDARERERATRARRTRVRMARACPYIGDTHEAKREREARRLERERSASDRHCE